MMNRLPEGPARLVRSRRRPYSGVSLLEVVFSIGVVMIGLVGIASLMPLGGALARKGAVADAAARLGANAAHEFFAREMANSVNWRWYNGTLFTTVTVAPTNVPQPGMSFCLDPVFISEADPADANYAVEAAARNQFPLNVIFDASITTMPRITLPSPPGMTPNGVLSPTVAKEWFVGADDLVFDLPTDRTLGPVQHFSFQNALPTEPLKRSTQGNISWMATIVPKLDRVLNTTISGINPTDEYTLSIIVFDRRPVDRAGTLGNEDDVGERVVTVGAFYSGAPAFSGGDITLLSRPTRYPAGEDDLTLRSGDWIMFSGRKSVMNVDVTPAVPVGPTIVHKWYRVVNAGEDPTDNGTTWSRDVTVVGPDWDLANIPVTQATIVRGVVQVMERTIRLETSSMWTN